MPDAECNLRRLEADAGGLEREAGGGTPSALAHHRHGCLSIDSWLWGGLRLAERNDAPKRRLLADAWRVRVAFVAEKNGRLLVAFSRAQLLDLVARTEERERDAAPEMLH
jgi:hypothetical protein